MEIKYKIVSLNEEKCSAVVNYYTDICPEGITLGIDFHPDEDGSFPSEEDIKTTISKSRPETELKRMEAVASGKGIDHLKHLVGEEGVTAKIEMTPKVDPTNQDFEKLVADLMKS